MRSESSLGRRGLLEPEGPEESMHRTDASDTYYCVGREAVHKENKKGNSGKKNAHGILRAKRGLRKSGEEFKKGKKTDMRVGGATGNRRE